MVNKTLLINKPVLTDNATLPDTVSTAFTLYDLHSHTTASDGSLTPAALVLRAAQMRVGVLAITDHDTTAGLAEAATTIEQEKLALRLISGVEISTLWENHEIHIVGLGIDEHHPSICKLLREQSDHRYVRAQEISARLAKSRIPDAWEGASRLAQGGRLPVGILLVIWWNWGWRAMSGRFLKVFGKRQDRLCPSAMVYNRTSY